MKFSDPSPSLLDHITLPTESVGLQARRSHSPGVKLVARTFFLSLVIVCSLVVFLISYCASRLRLTGPHDTRRLVDGGADEDTPLLESCSRSPSRSTLSLKSLWAAAPSDDLAGSEGSQAHFLGYVEYPFPRIPGEQNRLTLRKLMRKIYSWRLPHLGNSEKSCSFQTGNINFTVEATEVRKHFLWPRQQDMTDASTLLEEYILRTKEDMLKSGARRQKISNGFLIKEEGRAGCVGEIQMFVDACWAESPTPLADLPGADEGDGAASGTAGVSASRDLRHQPKPAKAGKEGRSPSPSKPAQHLISPQGKYRFARIPGDDNEQVLEALMEAFHETSLPHRGKRKRRRLLQIGNLYVSVGFVEIRKRWGWPTVGATHLAAEKVEASIIHALEKFHRGQPSISHAAKRLTVRETGGSSSLGVTEFSVKVYRINRPLRDLTARDASGAAGSASTSSQASSWVVGHAGATSPSHGGASAPSRSRE